MATDRQLKHIETARASAHTPEANAKRAATRAATMKRKKREKRRAAREGKPAAPDPAHTPEANAKRRATLLANGAKKRKSNGNGGNGHAMSIPLDAIPERMPPTPPRRMVATNVHAGNGNGARPRDREARLMLAAGLIQLLQTILE